MFEIAPELIKNRQQVLKEKKDKIPIGSLLKWMDPRVSPLKISDFLTDQYPFILDLPVLRDREPYDVAKKYVDKGFRVFSVSTNPYWEDGYDDFISYLKRSKKEFKFPVIRREIFFESYQIVETRLFWGDSFTVFPSVVEKERLRIILEDAENLEFEPIAIIKSELEYKLLKRAGKIPFVAFPEESGRWAVKKVKKLRAKPILYNPSSPEVIESFKKRGVEYFWVSWRFVEKFPSFFK